MRKTVPFIATALASVLITAGIMQASAGAQVDPVLRQVGQPVSEFLGLELNLTNCNSSPNNAPAWTRFARCAAANFATIKRWENKLDNCLTLFQVENRSNDAYYVDGLSTTEGSGLAPFAGPGVPRYLMEWRGLAACPRS
jgi:hypothetical protein